MEIKNTMGFYYTPTTTGAIFFKRVKHSKDKEDREEEKASSTTDENAKWQNLSGKQCGSFSKR